MGARIKKLAWLGSLLMAVAVTECSLLAIAHGLTKWQLVGLLLALVGSFWMGYLLGAALSDPIS